MSNITAILVDDEISNLKGLEKKLSILYPDIKILGGYQSPEDRKTNTIHFVFRYTNA